MKSALNASASDAEVGRPRLRLRTLLVLLGLLIFGLPLGGLGLLRVYDNQLVRQTEGELVAQGAFVAAAYRRALQTALGARLATIGQTVDPRFTALHRHEAEQPFSPIEAKLNLLSETIHPPAEPARPSHAPALPEAIAAGAEIEPVMRQAQRVSLAGMRVVDPAGTVVATTREEAGQNLAHREEVARALTGENVVLMRRRISDKPAPPLSSISRGTGVRIFVALPVVWEGRVLGAVILARTPQSLGKAFYGDRLYLVGTAIVLLLVVVAVTLVSTAFLVRPLEALTKQAEDVAAGRAAPPPLHHPGTVEVARLSRSFSAMARALEERADYIRSFAAAVSHEFKTPLAALHGTIELLRDHEPTMTQADRARFLGNLAEDTARLDRLVKRLLELARADVAQPAPTTQPVRPVVQALVDRYRADGRTIALTAPAETQLDVRMTPDILTTVIGNLIENAYQHGGSGARVALTARPCADGGAVEIAVSNDGRPLSAANAGRAFDPFFTTARDSGGTGLGLTIVRALLRAHGGTITLDAGATQTTFTVRLPA